ncbi:hypothetical protein [Adlercreutzia caecimuris]|uniref:hypothetical protein n=1 Tax=Adlercreutzia caecimuris TaxID=671266 RepID=UPI00272B60F3|nr:hypothetical protein [Adlercreutzia caecimuris]
MGNRRQVTRRSVSVPRGRNGRPRPYRPGQLDSAYVAAFRPQRRRKPWGVIILVVLLVALAGGGVAWGITTGVLPEAIGNLSALLPGGSSQGDDAAADAADADTQAANPAGADTQAADTAGADLADAAGVDAPDVDTAGADAADTQ